jgi:hypothetical protein
MRIAVTKDLGPLRLAAKARVDREAEEARLMLVTPGAAQAMVYLAKQTEARRFVADATVGPLMTAEIGLTAPDADALAALWLAMEQAWLEAAAAVEVKRFTAKAAIDAATHPAAVEAASQVDWSS